MKATNTTGSTAADVRVSYNIWYFNDENRANSLNFSYSLDDSAYTSIPSLNFTTPEVADVSPTWASVVRSATIGGVNLADGASIYLKWTGADVSGSGSRDEYGIDDVYVGMGDLTVVALASLTARSGRQSVRPWQVTWPVTLLGAGLISVLAGLAARKRR